ncbi:nuclear transport factor 2 family protein [Aquimarina gracilis]|uniref:Nuclear transport factor 2 family protein n=1 Tax=Aquimarina gracilis TaxID=874422 RepID=A0ABU5ZSY2_9FLAO|nr:nuclear transport factor 2 family protein [Aquimarina gracilis]MEB3345165.1 nuclear transport factor 2 family protein [Aquimarina gracilis]
MKSEEFIKAYENALATQNWKNIEPLVSENVSVTFSDGTIHIGKENVQKAFEGNFNIIKNEKYVIENIKWLVKDKKYAVYLFEFNWTGIIDEKPVSGNGIGTSVLIKEDARWKLLTEHLGRKPK